MRVLVTTLGRGHFIQVADSLRRNGVDADLTQGWIVKNPERNFFVRLAAKIMGRKSLIWGFSRRTTPALDGHNFADFFSEFVQTCFMLFFSKVWKSKNKWHWGVKTGFWLHGLTMVRLIRRGDYQIAHIKSGLGRFAIAEAKRRGVKVLVDHSAGAPQFVVETVDREDWADHHSFWWTVMQDCDDADILMVNSDWVKETFLMYGYPAEKIRVVYMGLDHKFNGLRDWADETMDGLGTPEKPLRIVFSGPFQPHKGNEVFLESINRLAKTKLCFDVDVIGTATIGEEIRNRCALAMNKIRFHGHVPQDEMCELMKSAHVYLFPSRSEGCAKSAFEAMSMGLCVVCTKETGLPLKDGFDGHLILKDDAASIVAKIEYLVRNPALIKATGMNATETLKKYTWDSYAENVKKVYAELLG